MKFQDENFMLDRILGKKFAVVGIKLHLSFLERLPVSLLRIFKTGCGNFSWEK